MINALIRKVFTVIFIIISLSCEEEKSTTAEETNYSDITFIKDFSSYTNCGFKLDVKQTYDLGYILAGCKNDSAMLIKIDPFGEVVWEKTFGSDEGMDWAGEAIDLTNDGGSIIAVDDGSFGFLKTSNI